MALYRKKLTVIEAMQFTSMDSYMQIHGWVAVSAPEIAAQLCFSSGGDRAEEMKIQTREGRMTANPGDWIIMGTQGDFYPCKPDIFSDTYEEVS